MTADNEVLKIISNETKSSINPIAIVTPSMYASIFSKFAVEHDAQIEDEEELAKNLIISECSELTNLQVQTAKNAQQLSKSTDKAIGAIKEKDESVLNEVLKETEELRKEIEKLKESIYKDELTNAYNRKWMHDNMLNDDAQTFKRSGTLAMIDLNYFKLINDTYGHIVGDKVLVFIANQLKLTRKPIVRYGGDEFIVIFSDVTSFISDVEKLHKLREDILRKQLKVKNESFRISFSIGAIEFKKNDFLVETIEKADNNMYRDKEKIKKRIPGI